MLDTVLFIVNHLLITKGTEEKDGKITIGVGGHECRHRLCAADNAGGV